MTSLDSQFKLNEIEIVNYYDNYDYLAGGIMNNSLLKSKAASNSSVCTTGMQTGVVLGMGNNQMYVYTNKGIQAETNRKKLFKNF